MSGLPAITPAQARLPRTYEARCVVYFIQNTTSGAVKIGYTGDLARRFSSIQSGSADELRVIRTVDGGRSTEAWLHKRFSAYRIKGEWFSFHPEMMDVVAPDVVPAIARVEVRRDVRLTLRERVVATELLGAEMNLSAQQMLLMLATGMSDAEAHEVLEMIRGE